MARLCPLFSGSGGNSYYIGSRSAGILIDVGRSAKQVDAMLKSCGVEPMAVQGIFLTHEHSDHVSGLRVFSKKYGIPVFGSEGTLRALEGTLEGAKTYVAQRETQFADLVISPFSTSHDCAQPVGYRIRTGDGRIFSFCTDLGVLSEEVKENLLGADFVVLESNHDIGMLQNGPYPYSLKRRILSPRGHLSNADCAAFLPQLAASGTKRFLLAHLSRENNTRSAALEAALSALVQAGYVKDIDFQLDAARSENRDCKTTIF